MNLLELMSGNLIDPTLIRGIAQLPRKGVLFKDARNETLAFEPELDPFYQKAIVKAVVQVLKAGKEWQQPDWMAEYAKADKAREAAKQGLKTPRVSRTPPGLGGCALLPDPSPLIARCDRGDFFVAPESMENP